MLSQTLRNRWVVMGLHAGLWVLLYLMVANLSDKVPPFQDDLGTVAVKQVLPPMSQLASLYTAGNSPTNRVHDASRLNPFVTQHFVPAPAPAPPPPPTTKKIELTYLGFYQAAGGAPQTMIQFADRFLVTPVGGKVLSNLYVGSVTMQSLTLTNPLAQTNVLSINVKKVVEVPLQ